MPDKRPDSVQKIMQKTAEGQQSEQELTFDPESGELVVIDSSETSSNPDSTTIDQIAEDGFFFAISSPSTCVKKGKPMAKSDGF